MICQSTSSFNLSNAEEITGELSALWMICESPDPMLSLGPNVCDLDFVQEFRFLGVERLGLGFGVISSRIYDSLIFWTCCVSIGVKGAC